MWIADKWEDYELIDCGGGEKLERWGRQILVRPDPQAGKTRRDATTARPPAADIGTRKSCPSSGRCVTAI